MPLFFPSTQSRDGGPKFFKFPVDIRQRADPVVILQGRRGFRAGTGWTADVQLKVKGRQSPVVHHQHHIHGHQPPQGHHRVGGHDLDYIIRNEIGQQPILQHIKGPLGFLLGVGIIAAVTDHRGSLPGDLPGLTVFQQSDADVPGIGVPLLDGDPGGGAGICQIDGNIVIHKHRFAS